MLFKHAAYVYVVLIPQGLDSYIPTSMTGYSGILDTCGCSFIVLASYWTMSMAMELDARMRMAP